MYAVILTMLTLMGTWNIAVTIWVLKKRNNPHSLPCEEHGNNLIRLEKAIESAMKEVISTQQTVAVLWNEAHPGQPMKR